MAEKGDKLDQPTPTTEQAQPKGTDMSMLQAKKMKEGDDEEKRGDKL